MVRKLCKDDRLKYFGHLKKSEGLGKIILEGKKRGEKRKGKAKKAVGKGHSGRFRQANNRSWTMGT